MVRSYYLFITLIGFYIVEITAAQCPSGWTQHGSQCYWFSGDKAEWAVAEATCKAFSSKLAEPRTMSAASFITGRTQQLHDNFWIGISDLVIEGEWIYPSDRTPVTVTHWGPGEPNRHEDENCVASYLGAHGLWADLQCHNAEKYVCESPINNGGDIIG